MSKSITSVTKIATGDIHHSCIPHQPKALLQNSHHLQVGTGYSFDYLTTCISRLSHSQLLSQITPHKPAYQTFLSQTTRHAIMMQMHIQEHPSHSRETNKSVDPSSDPKRVASYQQVHEKFLTKF